MKKFDWSKDVNREEQYKLIAGINEEMAQKLANQLICLAKEHHIPDKLEVRSVMFYNEEEMYTFGAAFEPASFADSKTGLVWSVQGDTSNGHYYLLKFYDWLYEENSERRPGRDPRYHLCVEGDFRQSDQFWPKSQALIERQARETGQGRLTVSFIPD